MADETPEAAAAVPATPTAASIAGTVSTVDEEILKFMPFVSTILAVIPGAQIAVPFLPIATEILGVIDNAAKAVAGGNTGVAIQDVFNEIKNHLTPGAPNSAALS